MTHAHLTTIVLSIVLFFVTLAFEKKGRNTKVLKMILRVMYLLIFATGGMMLFSLYKITALYALKALLGFVMIGLFEMVLAMSEKSKNLAGFWILFIVVLALVIFLGLKLPMGIYI